MLSCLLNQLQILKKSNSSKSLNVRKHTANTGFEFVKIKFIFNL